MTRLTLGQGTIRVANNRTIDQALQINGFVDDSWVDFTQNITIEDNEAKDQSIQVNTPIKLDTFDKLIATRNKTIEAIASSSQWSQPPPMPQQSMPQPALPQRARKRIPQARPSQPLQYYGQPSVIQNANPTGIGARGTIPVPMKVVKAKKQAPKVTSGKSGG